jgi:ESS family glutamate:Na+ symporter
MNNLRRWGRQGSVAAGLLMMALPVCAASAALESERAIRTQEVSTMDMLSLSIVVLFVGMYLNRKIRILGDNYIPPAVTGGLLFSLFTWFCYAALSIEVEFDLTARDLLLLVFFSTIGLSARLKTLVAGGRSLLILVVVAAIFLALQDALGIGIAMGLGAHPAYGLLAGSISFAGGHGTAIAWGAVAEEAGLARASEIGLAFATFGLVAGGLVGGPIARRLLKVRGIEGSTEEMSTPSSDAAGASDASDSFEATNENIDAERPGDWLYPALATLLVLALCVSLGDLVNRYLSMQEVRLPGFLTAMFVGILVTNLADTINRPLARATIDRFGEVSLHIFLAMSMMTIQLWALGNAASAILFVLLAQILLMTMFAVWVVYRVMGRDYDAIVIAAGFAGLGLGATPVAIANMNAVTARYGPSTKAFLVVPLVGAFFIDLLNAGTINFFIKVIQNHLV